MYAFAFFLLVFAMLAALGSVARLLLSQWPGGRRFAGDGGLKKAEYAGLALTVCLCLASSILLRALVACDFSLAYVADYTDLELPLFYRMTAFWAGQSGSLLFWAFAVALCGALFQLSKTYAGLSAETRRWYWVFYLATMAFFCLLLVTWNNPFLTYPVPPADGGGLNPMLQNPGMIFHPPLLFLGYGGFIIPGCLALAQTLGGGRDQANWIELARPFMLAAWSMLTAGIVLGAWWAYMELGWGGYWAWDPVENASLLPWLASTAALHTMLVQSRRGKLTGVNVLLTALTTISAFFASYLTRSGVVQSVHAFGGSGMGLPLLVFMALALLVALIAGHAAGKNANGTLAGPESREGFVVLSSWLLLALAAIVLVATLWPVFSGMWHDFMGTPVDPSSRLDAAGHDHGGAVGLSADFYNRVCLPLFATLIALLAICPWLRWKGGVRSWPRLGGVIAVFFLSLAGLWFSGYRLPTALLGAASACAVIAGFVLLVLDRRARTDRSALCGAGIHLGMALLVLGIAFSGPYKKEVKILLSKGETAEVGDRSVTLKELYTGNGPGYVFLEGELEVRSGDAVVGTVSPQRRVYSKWKNMQATEAATLPSLGDEFYATLLGVDKKGRATLHLSLNPLVNWLWIGGAIMCLLPLCMLRRRPKAGAQPESREEE